MVGEAMIGQVPIVALRGAPGVGKSTTAAALRKRHRFAVVEVDDLRGELWHAPALDGLDGWGRHQVAIAQAAGMALALRLHGWRVVVVDTFNTPAVVAFERATRGRAPILPIALVVEPVELARRLAERPEVPGVFRDAEVSVLLNDELRGWANHIDITRMSPADVADHIATSLSVHGTIVESWSGPR